MGVVEVYQKTRKRPDLFWNTYVARPPAAVIVWSLEKTRVTPDQITLGAFVVAAVSALGIVFLPGYAGLLAAVVVFELSYVLDCVDGMLARYRGTASATGHLLDFLMDEIKAFMVLGAVAVRLYLERHDTTFLLLGVAGLIALSTGIAITTFQRRPEISGKPADAKEGKAEGKRSLVVSLLAIPMGVAKFLVHYPSYILYVAIAGRIDFYFYAYLVVNVLYALKSLAWLALRFGRFRSREA
ncbi:MAG: CDP-alcohol phosphatidyltransferase family protein [Myxococcales bacterium]|nr:CDP-alcohol phosphatidyltransferase family protein [Myxococcales bacterium]